MLVAPPPAEAAATSIVAAATSVNAGPEGERALREAVVKSKYIGKMYAVSAIALQRMVRGFIGRTRVYRRVIKRHADAKGLLAAVRGTHQGESGWYLQAESYYYFTLHQAEYVLLCGPITRSMYDIAVAEMRTAWGAEYRKARSDLCFRVDRLGLHATMPYCGLAVCYTTCTWAPLAGLTLLPCWPSDSATSEPAD